MPPTAKQICDGDAGCAFNVVCAPFVLVYNALKIYVFSCCWVLGGRAKRFFCKGLIDSCCGPWVFTDTSFEGDAAIGQQGKQLDWVRAIDILPKEERDKGVKPMLYEGGIKAADLCQGAVGDCWLVAALACAAEHPSSIRNAFDTLEANSRGKYNVRLFDPEKQAWEVVTVDDRIPCRKGTTRPEYMKCDGKELWPVLLEKAFAKFCGSYNALDGGWAVWGWRVLTGDNIFRLKYDDGAKEWKRWDFECRRGKEGIDASVRSTKESFSKDLAWNLILNYIDDKSLIAASGGKEMGRNISVDSGANAGGLNGEQLNDAAGLVGTHAYSILDARELGLIPGLSLGAGVLGQTRLIRLRNPWGSYEWKGAWSDGSKEWADNPLVKMRLRPKDEDDGTFWMPWDQFEAAGFKTIDVCDRTTKRDLRLNVTEDWGFCGIVAGCLGGLAKFFCFCQGCLVLYFGSHSSAKTKTTARGCAKCAEDCKRDEVVEPVPVQIDRA